jgi:hypothetical protein
MQYGWKKWDILAENPEGRRLLGIPKYKWNFNAKIDFE